MTTSATAARQFGSSAPEAFSNNSAADPSRQNFRKMDIITAHMCRLCSGWKADRNIDTLISKMRQMGSQWNEDRNMDIVTAQMDRLCSQWDEDWSRENLTQQMYQLCSEWWYAHTHTDADYMATGVVNYATEEVHDGNKSKVHERRQASKQQRREMDGDDDNLFELPGPATKRARLGTQHWRGALDEDFFPRQATQTTSQSLHPRSLWCRDGEAKQWEHMSWPFTLQAAPTIMDIPSQSKCANHTQGGLAYRTTRMTRIMAIWSPLSHMMSDRNPRYATPAMRKTTTFQLSRMVMDSCLAWSSNLPLDIYLLMMKTILLLPIPTRLSMIRTMSLVPPRVISIGLNWSPLIWS